jgi:hypothetical protein
MIGTRGLTARLVDLEREGWAALVAGNGGAYYRNHLSANALMAFPFGVLTRAAAVEAMDSAPPWDSFEISDTRVVELGQGAAILAYRVVAQRRGQEPYAAILSSTFVRDGEDWKLAFHQQSPAPKKP